MKKKATEDQFNELHNLVTKEFLLVLRVGKLLLKILKQLVIGLRLMTSVV